MRVLGFLVLWILATACLNDQDCLITSTNLVKIQFKNLKNKNKNIKLDSVEVSGLGYFYPTTDSISNLALPVSPMVNEATFTFYYYNSSPAVTVEYFTQAQVISAKCGAFTNYIDLRVTTTSFDSLKIINDRLRINQNANLEIFIE
ncbi:MAG: hypothetical protein JNM78_01290 [Cyclobacteriaceae bacterium]|nr:hypothetical protein [Cyclobacteriaceae bacterium]